MKIRLVVSGRHYHWAEALPAELEVGDGARVADALTQIALLLPTEAQLPETCLVALSGRHLGSVARCQDAALAEGDELVLIAPVAGG